jgi:hypothetical protein
MDQPEFWFCAHREPPRIEQVATKFIFWLDAAGGL